MKEKVQAGLDGEGLCIRGRGAHASNAIHVHGVTGECPMERYLRNARVLTIPDGTTQINQLIIGLELTGMPAFLGARGHKSRKALAG